jgi:hypothetical protein
MKKLTTLLMTLMLMSTALWADETVTVSANSSDISEGLDLKVVAKLFAEAKNLEEFETMLNNPDSAFCNLDLNGDGQVDYLRVVETGEGSKRLIVLQAVLAKDIYQDVASIYVEKDEAQNEVKVQIVGDEYVYGTNYIIEPVYVYRPVIYDWFWGPSWVAWNSPWYWGYYPSWWYVHNCWAHDWYWHHCYAWHHHHHHCSFRPGRSIHTGYHDLHRGVTRRDYAVAHPDRAFVQRNSGMTNAREIRSTNASAARRSSASISASSSSAVRSSAAASRTYGSQNTAAARSASNAAARSSNNVAAARSSSNAAASRSTSNAAASRSSSNVAASRSSSNVAASRSSSNVAASRSTSAPARSSSTYSGGASRSSGFSSSSSYSSGASRSSGFSGGASRSSGFSSGGASRGGGGGAVRR